MTSIRFAKVEDADEIACVHVTAWLETYRGLIPDGVLDNLSVERRAKQWRDSLEDPTDIYRLLLVAEQGGKIVGFASFGREQEGDSDFRGELFALYVLKQFHGQGIGRMLVQRSAEGLLTLDISSMLVWVLAENLARKFYERLGGVYLREKPIEFGGSILMEQAYGWRDIRPLAGKVD